MAKPSIEVEISLKDKLSATLDGVKSKIAGSQTSVSGLADKFKSLNSTINEGIKTAALWGAGIAAAGAAGLAAIGMEAIKAGADLDDLAEKTGLSVESLQQWRFAAEEAAVPAETLEASMKKLNLNMGELRHNAGPLAGELKKVAPQLYVQLKAADSTEKAFELALGGIQKLVGKDGLPDIQRQASLAMMLFGKSGQDMALLARRSMADVKSSFKAVEAAGMLTGEQAKAMGETDDAMGRVKLSATALRNTIAANLAPAVTDLATKLTSWINANKGLLAQRMTEWLTGVVDGIKAIDWEKVWSGIQSTASAMGKFFSFVSDPGNLAALVTLKLALDAISLGFSLMAGAETVALGPVMLIVGVIAGITAGVIALVKYWDDIGRAIQRAGEKLDIFGLLKDEGPTFTVMDTGTGKTLTSQEMVLAGRGNELPVAELQRAGKDLGVLKVIVQGDGTTRTELDPQAIKNVNVRNDTVTKQERGIRGGGARRGDL